MTSVENATEPLVVRRVLDAPPAAVFRAWTDPKYIARWAWGGQHDTVSVDIDCRAGGMWHQKVRNRETGDVWTFAGEIREVVPGSRLVHTFHWVSDKGVDHGPSLVAIDFTAKGKGTEVVITHTELGPEREGTRTGWGKVLDAVDGVIAEGD